ncbi:BgTH12-04934 [Blumeria graminis f. sp. triticale]|uniref:BgTH12-04934 n=1 Tax=Blumeria graminis f. sp. triticale TaxID=1689686 RepID=A0A9W4GF08_BLUGR|nr:BgTH12-04934 [Blumeria graminis f. sp. triticale]
MYDVFDDKVHQFLRACELLEIRPSKFHVVFDQMLEDRALLYYTCIKSRQDSFEKAYTKIKLHFDTDANLHIYLQEWQTLTFARLKNENPDKGLRDVLDILFDELSTC